MRSPVSESTTNYGKRLHVAFCCLPQTIFVALWAGISAGGYWVLLPAVLLLGLLPSLDLITGRQDDAHFEENDFSRAEVAVLRWNTRLYAVLTIASVIGIVVGIDHFSRLEIGLLVASVGLTSGIGFAAAHELLHSKGKLDDFLQRALTSVLFYPHYKLIHVRSHHVNVGTEEDENTAWMNEGVYAYMLRTIPRSMIRCGQIEAKTLVRHGHSPWAAALRNKMLVYALGQLGLVLGLYFFSGPLGLSFYLAEVVFAHLVLESVNYIQHYGLLRKKQGGGHEKTRAEHSWDTYHFFSSYVTFRVGHHSHHHLSVKPYYLLATEPHAHQLPVGYLWAISMVLVPPWWRAVMNPIVRHHADGSVKGDRVLG